jgi:hypothetical protein
MDEDLGEMLVAPLPELRLLLAVVTGLADEEVGEELGLT